MTIKLGLSAQDATRRFCNFLDNFTTDRLKIGLGQRRRNRLQAHGDGQ